MRLGFYFFIPDKNKEGPFGGMPQKNCRNLDNSGFCNAFLSFFLTSVDRDWEEIDYRGMSGKRWEQGGGAGGNRIEKKIEVERKDRNN